MILKDADELKEIISEEITRKFVRWDKTITVAEWETFTRDVIDNAPTINELPEKYIIQVKTREDAQKIKNVWDKNNFGNVIIASENMDIIPLRPQGEWLKAQGEWVTDTAYKICFKCSECKSHFEFPFNFCPNCGAQMKTRTDAD